MDTEMVGRPMDILLVEDDLLQARLTIEAIRRGNFRHRTSLIRDGQESLDFLFRRGIYRHAPRPDLILLDLRLPTLDGLEVLASIRADDDLKLIPVVIMTVSEDECDRLSCEHQEVDVYLTKPFDLEKFLRLLRQLRQFWHDDLLLPPALIS